MKALSVKQPWASLFFHGKNIENRTWQTKYRGDILIHASAKIAGKMSDLLNDDQIKSLGLSRYNDQLLPAGDANNFWPIGIMIEAFTLSAIIGKVTIVDCVINHPSIWAEKSNPSIDWTDGSSYIHGEKPIYNWVLENPILFDEPILNVKGGLSLWNYEM
jgi:ASCH domain